jgi:hypothetical protein
MKNGIRTWQQGQFVDQRQYDKMGSEWKEKMRREEAYKVRPGPTDNAICQTFNPGHAKWIADRLNLASKLEQMAYDFATGKTDGSDLVAFVRASVNA